MRTTADRKIGAIVMGIEGKVDYSSIKQYHQAHLLECEDGGREGSWINQCMHGTS